MIKINIVSSDFLGTSGYGVHTRYLANSLHELGAEVRVECPKPENWTRFVTDAELLMLTRPMSKEFVSILIGQPQWINTIKSENPKAVGVFLVWEGNKLPSYWIDHLKLADFVLVPSTHVLDALRNTSTNFEEDFKNKTFIVPHGVDFNKFNFIERKKDRPFTFLFNKGWRGGMEDRSGLQYLLLAYDQEFTKDDNVRLLIHINPAYLHQGFSIQTEFEKLGLDKIRDNKAPIAINLDNLSDKQLIEFYSEGDVYVCPTRAEGFNIAGLEAKATGMPNIQTVFGGQTDYMNGYDMGITFELREVKNDIQYEGIEWAVPNLDNLRQCLREMYNKRDILPTYSQGISDSVKDFSWRNSGRKLLESLKLLNL